ncbi:olfactory receptor 8S1-like [Peromyscus eremicus]|uniref:olfactory receptor 8S1-like n=1 Tax=Peromyscus eremicus TaxID=42410 RepID=UPI0027DD7BF5|nr:olfactory receptor 8S1-like [Peromyscus eremicus]
MEVRNVTEFVLLGLTSNPRTRVLLFALFLVIYLLTLTGNLLMLLVIGSDSHLRTPMYFFLRHLSFIDAFYSSVIVPKLLRNLISEWKTISSLGCFTQIALVIFSGATEACLLSAMAYDRFQAVCHPLLYVVTMNGKVCSGLAGISWAIGISASLINTLLLAQEHFCGPNVIHSFACEIPPVLSLKILGSSSFEQVIKWTPGPLKICILDSFKMAAPSGPTSQTASSRPALS